MKPHKMTVDTAMLDRVELTVYDFGKLYLSRLEYMHLREALGKELFGNATHYNANSTYRSISVPHASGTGYLKYIPEKKRCTLTLKIKLNPTRLLQFHLMNEYKVRKRKSFDGNDNFVPHHLQWFFGRRKLRELSLSLFVNKIETIIDEIADCMEATVSSYRRSDTPKISWSLMEVYWDLHSSSPYYDVDLIKPSWMSHFRSSQCPHLAGQMPSEQVLKSAKYLTGTSRVKEHYKIYTKSSNLVRHEVQFWNTRIRSICKTTVLGSLTSQSICAFIIPLADHAFAEFIEISKFGFNSKIEYNAFKPLYDLAQACGRNAYLFDQILSELRHNRRLASQPTYYPIMPRLMRTGEWEKIGLGIYRPSALLLSLIDRLYQLPDD